MSVLAGGLGMSDVLLIFLGFVTGILCSMSAAKKSLFYDFFFALAVITTLSFLIYKNR